MLRLFPDLEPGEVFGAFSYFKRITAYECRGKEIKKRAIATDSTLTGMAQTYIDAYIEYHATGFYIALVAYADPHDICRHALLLAERHEYEEESFFWTYAKDARRLVPQTLRKLLDDGRPFVRIGRVPIEVFNKFLEGDSPNTPEKALRMYGVQDALNGFVRDLYFPKVIPREVRLLAVFRYAGSPKSIYKVYRYRYSLDFDSIDCPYPCEDPLYRAYDHLFYRLRGKSKLPYKIEDESEVIDLNDYCPYPRCKAKSFDIDGHIDKLIEEHFQSEPFKDLVRFLRRL